MENVHPPIAESTDPLELIVTEYLRAKGFSKTLMELDCESKELRSSQVPAHNRDGESGHIGLVYEQSYSTFKAWVLSAIDIFVDELNLLSFPVFAKW